MSTTADNDELCRVEGAMNAGGDLNVAASGERDESATCPETVTKGVVVQRHTAALYRLDDEYEQLSVAEKELRVALARMVREESALRAALELSSTSLREQRERGARMREEAAVSRLESALLGDDLSDSGSSSSDNEGRIVQSF